jgi:glucose-6-phosphate dehydrogenase assembly protein OpcA
MTTDQAVSIPVPLKDVERALTQRMKELQGPGEAPVQRAHVANLVVYCSTREQAAQVDAQLPQVIACHPARVLLLIGEPGLTDVEVSASITVRPIRVGRTEQAYAEQVTLHAAGPSVQELPFALRSLLIGDLPTNLWWAVPVPPPLAGPMLYELAEEAQQIMYDSLGWTDPTRGVAATASWLDQAERPAPGGRWRVASDLNWRRLKYWRRMMTQTADSRVAPLGPHSARDMLVEHGPHAVIQAWELVSWLTTRLGWQVQKGKVQPGTEMAWRFRRGTEEGTVRIRRLEQGPPEIRCVRIACILGDTPGAVNMTVEDGQRLVVTLEGVEAAPRTSTIPPHSPAELIGRQLSDRERDPVFRQSMKVAQTMAQSLL